MNKYPIFLSFLLLAFTSTLLAQIPEDCTDRQQANGWPEYYCDCKYNYQTFALPLDLQVSESIWFKGNVSELAQGISAYLYSDCEFSFEVYMSCTAKTPRYQTVFEPNQANSIDGSTIKRKLEEEGFSELEASFYICITPVNGLGGRLVMRSEADGMPSSCDDPLYIFPGMSLLSTRTYDVYALDPNNLPVETDFIFQWKGNDHAACQLDVTIGSCDGPTIAQVDMLSPNDIYVLSAEIVDEAWNNDEQIFLHFSHDPNTSGFVCSYTPEYEENYIDTLLCQGMGVQVNDTLLTEPTVYVIDTVHTYANVYTINFYDVSFYEPELQYDTLGLYESQLPYLYRGQYSVTDFGEYDVTIHTPGQCDEQYALSVYHKIDTIITVRDTALCYGAKFKYQNRLYTENVSFESTTWKNADTYLIDSLHVYFATTPEIVYDTINVNERKYGRYFDTEGDFTFTAVNTTSGCVDSIILHVQPSLDGVTYTYEYFDEELCQGLVYDYYGDLYTSSVVLSDSIWYSESECVVEVTTVTFIPPTPYYDTISIKSTALPYNYRGQKINEFGTHDITIHQDGECDERYVLTLVHNIDTLYQTVDTALCQGTAYEHNGISYTQPVSLVDKVWQDADTYVITTTHVHFKQPVEVSITKEECDSYTWNDSTYTTSGIYTYTTTAANGCDSVVTLHLTINKTVYTEETVTACDSYEWNGQTYDQSGDYVYTTTAANGCDSVVTLHLTINKTIYTEETVTACDSYTWNGQTYDQSDDYVYTTTAANGCDSVVTLHLTILAPAETQRDTIYVCASDLPYVWYEKSITEPGIYSHIETYQSAQCDSVSHELIFGIYTQDLPAEVTMPIVKTGKPIDVSAATADILTHIELDTWYAPNALITWLVKYGADWEVLSDNPVDSTIKKLLLKYLVETDCGIIESQEMEFDFCTTNLDIQSPLQPSVRKVFYQNTMYIIRDGKVYDTLGIRIL